MGVIDAWGWCGDRLAHNLETAASLAALYRLGYERGFDHGKVLKEFCEEYIPEPYFPVADTRPTADRLNWAEYCKHMLGAEGSCARCEGT